MCRWKFGAIGCVAFGEKLTCPLDSFRPLCGLPLRRFFPGGTSSLLDFFFLPRGGLSKLNGGDSEETVTFLALPSPLSSGILLSKRPSPWENGRFLKITGREENGESTLRTYVSLEFKLRSFLK